MDTCTSQMSMYPVQMISKLFVCVYVCVCSIRIQGLTTQSFRNPFDIVRSSLLEHVCRMRANFLHTSSTSVPNLIEEGESWGVTVRAGFLLGYT